jgi:hypothetical protein
MKVLQSKILFCNNVNKLIKVSLLRNQSQFICNYFVVKLHLKRTFLLKRKNGEGMSLEQKCKAKKLIRIGGLVILYDPYLHVFF